MSMVDITGKPESYREATARGWIKLRAETIKRVKDGMVEKGDPIDAARIAGILAAKKTSEIIPLCHPIPLTNVRVDVKVSGPDRIEVESTVKTKSQTGVEMEALVATAVALLTIWDMTKQYEKDSEGQYPYTIVSDIHVVRKVKKSL